MGAKIVRHGVGLFAAGCLLVFGAVGCGISSAAEDSYLPYTQPVTLEGEALQNASGALADTETAVFKSAIPVIDGHELIVWNHSRAVRVYVGPDDSVKSLGSGTIREVFTVASTALQDDNDRHAYEVARVAFRSLTGDDDASPPKGGLLSAHGVRFESGDGSSIVVRVDVEGRAFLDGSAAAPSTLPDSAYLPYTEPESVEEKIMSRAEKELVGSDFASFTQADPVIDGHEVFVFNDEVAVIAYVDTGGSKRPLSSGYVQQMSVTPTGPLRDSADRRACEVVEAAFRTWAGDSDTAPARGGLLCAHRVRFEKDDGSYVIVRVDAQRKASVMDSAHAPGSAQGEEYLPYTPPARTDEGAMARAMAELEGPALEALRNHDPVIDGHEVLVWNDDMAACIYVGVDGSTRCLGSGTTERMLAIPSVSLEGAAENEAYRIARLAVPKLMRDEDMPLATRGTLCAHGVRFEDAAGSSVVVRVDIEGGASLTHW